MDDETTGYKRPKRRRCPHDGGTCHHSCAPDECFREERGMALTTPHEGYPLTRVSPDEEGLRLLKEHGLIEGYEVHEDGSYSFTPKFPIRKVACRILPETDND